MKTHLDCRQDGLLYLFRIKSDILLQFCFLFLLLFVCFFVFSFFSKNVSASQFGMLQHSYSACTVNVTVTLSLIQYFFCTLFSCC